MPRGAASLNRIEQGSKVSDGEVEERIISGWSTNKMSSTNAPDTAPHFRTIFEMSPAEIEIIMQDVTGYLQGLRAAHLGWVAISTLLVWDILRTMDKEIHYVWKSRWSYAKVIFLANRYIAPMTILCIIPHWFWIIFCTLTVATASFVLGSRLWAIYERDRKALYAIIAGFLACFVPAWTLTFLDGTRGGFDADELRVFGSVWLYTGGILMQDGLDGLDWRLTKCYRSHFPKMTNSIIIGSLLYESGICAAMVWKMYQDKKKTRIIRALYREYVVLPINQLLEERFWLTRGVYYYGVMFGTYGLALGLGFTFNDPIVQGFITCGFYTAIKSMVCSHIILRLRSYFSDGDPVIDGYDPSDPFEEQLEAKAAGKSTSSSFISTIIHFAQLISRPGGDVAYELRSKPVAKASEPASEQVDEAGMSGGGATNFHVASPTIHSSPNSRLRQELDWTDIPDPYTRLSILVEPSGSYRVESSSPPEQQGLPRTPKALCKRPSNAGDSQKGKTGASGLSEGPTQLLVTRSLQDPTTMLEIEDLTSVSRHGTPGRAISDPDLLAGDDPTPLSIAQPGQPLPGDP
ncbi:hypothetical protein FRC01_002334 [Tulasnella sp. 417]|nr:hypothetical protein FRC01_002334 [Tulasnella sp. 417]